MYRISLILKNDEFKNNLLKNDIYEEKREFCKHNLEHFLSVARIAYILNLEQNLNLNKEIIYAASLLHDIGRNVQYEKGIPHHEASADIAENILKDSNFKEQEIKDIISAIKNHRSLDENKLNSLIYRADKLSRNCFSCKSYKDCNWDINKKNKTIIV